MVFILAFLLSISLQAFGGDVLPAKLIARSNGPDSYIVPSMSVIYGTNPQMNTAKDITFRFIKLDDRGDVRKCIFHVNASAQTSDYCARKDSYVSDPKIRESGEILFSEFEVSQTRGIGVWKEKTEAPEFISPRAMGQTGFIYLGAITPIDGGAAFRAKTPYGNSVVRFFGGRNVEILTQEGEDDISYIFPPSFNSKGAYALKIREGKTGQWGEERPDRILLWTVPFSPMIIAEDKDANSSSEYLSFANSLALNKKNEIAFVAHKKQKSGVYLWSDGKVHTLIETGRILSEIEAFKPSLNNLGEVLFRAKDSEGKRGIWLAKKDLPLLKIVSEKDLILSDKGTARIWYDSKSPAFGASPSINDEGDILFLCSLNDKNFTKKWGSAIYHLPRSEWTRFRSAAVSRK